MLMSIAMPPEAGELVGEYKVIANIGTAGTGQLFEVEHCLTNRREVMKLLRTDVATETEVERFEREMAAQARLNHPNIAGLHNAFRLEGHLVLVMELVEGRTLESILNEGRLPIEAGLAYVQQVLSALAYMHKQHVIHRHVTPASLMVTPDGQVKLTNFDLAKSFEDQQLTRYGDILGSLPYMAPERLKSVSSPNPRSDLYAVGVILYEILTGKRPFANDRLVAVLTDSEQQPVAPSEASSGVSPKWDKIIATALSRD